MEIALRVEGVAKQYRIYERPADRLKETLTRGRLKRHREFWALKGISFELARGTTAGIVGPNGSGKSTLLQIVAGTLDPTHGRVWLAGRVAALLELGAGFNPEFTGVENVYLNAALHGFSKAETARRLPDIERFAEIGDFIRQPVKTYSSGMYVRLAFAIAVNADPDILVVDEALSVGDTIFQHRCVRRIKEMQARGVTILFVSHEPTLVRALCQRAILLYQGEALADGTPTDVLNRYQRLIMAREAAYADGAHATTNAGDDQATTEVQQPAPEGSAETQAETQSTSEAATCAPLQYQYRHGDGRAEVVAAELLNADGEPSALVESGQPVRLRMRFRFHADVERPVCGFMIRSRHGLNVYGTNTEQRERPLPAARRGDVFEATFAFDCWLGQEHYFVSVAVHSPDGAAYDWLDAVLFFRVACPVEMEGIANLDARVTARRVTAAEQHEAHALKA
ncbi:MAG TPA: ABC transporter ATP-binding protein [Pyrinomonadaceae bacterium]|jgi:ABC-type polysaccharide/polyol phosphate transport system ATPase subunit